MFHISKPTQLCNGFADRPDSSTSANHHFGARKACLFVFLM
ncbi:hypothetical protein [Chryseobacterium defluvii]|nr:hypothetical protein [Chryseobacterium defluvii]